MTHGLRALAVSVALLLAACRPGAGHVSSSPAPTGQPTFTVPKTLTIATPIGPTSALVYVAAAKGLLTQHGLRTEVVPFTSGRLALEALLAAKTDVALVAETPLALAAFQVPTFRIVATIARSPHKLVLAKGVSVRRAHDLKGRTVSALQGSAGHFWMDQYLRTGGLTERDVRYVNLQPADMVSSLTRGAIDAFFAWEPYPYLAQKQAGGSLNVIPSTGIYIQIFNVVVSEKMAETKPEVVTELLRALIAAEGTLANESAAVIPIVATSSNMDAETLGRIWADHTFRVELDASLLRALDAEAEWAQRTGLSAPGARKPEFRALIADSFLSRIDATRVSGF